MISIVIPFYNEEGNVLPLLSKIAAVLQDEEFEIISVNDGSTDNTLQRLQEFKKGNNVDLKIVNLRSNFGQTPALLAGFKVSQGSRIISMDGDLQNDPTEIPRFLEKIDEGFDVVCGWRKDRKDSLIKKLPSKFSNYLNRRLNKVDIHDSGCTFRAYIADAAKELNLSAEGHRYIPAILSYQGYKVTEIIVGHHSRKEGVTKYGSGRLFRGFMDLISLKLFYDYHSRPFLLFGKTGFPLFIIGLSMSAYLVMNRFLYDEHLSDRPLFFISIMTMIAALQIVLTGFIAELFVRETTKALDTYKIKEIL
ncbi:MAG: glycosyltransferase family 2 protein [Candidatus Kariarchaeaceae archaeon]